MRAALALTAVLAVTSQRACQSWAPAGGETIVGPWEEACRGLACGDSCGYCPPGTDPASCPVPTLAATACNTRGQCVTVGSFLCQGEACEGRACGITCDGACPYGAPCPAPVACDGQGRCVWKGPYLCYDPCADLSCGAACHLCPPGAADCVETALARACDRNGLCEPAPVTCP